MDFPIKLTGNVAEPLHLQLYQEYRSAILTGRLSPGQRVPSTRYLAKQLAVSRTTVSRTYDELISEGYLESSRGSGTYVCRQLPDESIAPPRNELPEDARGPAGRLSTYAARLSDGVPPDEPPVRRAVAFYSWCVGFDAYPAELWARLLGRHARTASRSTLDYESERLGCRRLREAIASYLGRSRAVQCTPDQILITNGSQQAFNLIVRVLVNAGDAAVVEEPGYIRIREILLSEGAQLLPVPVDQFGIDVSSLERLPATPKLIYVTPSHQSPTGAVLPLNRRLELVSWARENDVFVIEDDYDSEYRYAGRPFPSLQGLDQHGTVIYVGTFSKTLFPSLRLGYVVAPTSLLPALTRAKQLADRHCPTLEQLALADFIADGHLERHLRRTRLLYDRRRQALVGALHKHFGSSVSISGENAGIHILARFTTGLDDEEFLHRAASAGVTLASARPHYVLRRSNGEFLLGYASLTPEQIEDGISRLAGALKAESGCIP